MSATSNTNQHPGSEEPANKDVVLDMNAQAQTNTNDHETQHGQLQAHSPENKQNSEQRDYGTCDSDTSAAIACVAPAALEWKSISYSVPRRKTNASEGEPEDQRILDNVSGMARPGELVAILGSR